MTYVGAFPRSRTWFAFSGIPCYNRPLKGSLKATFPPQAVLLP